jgi:hypothetical protein
MDNELILGKAVNVFSDVNARINLLIDCSAKDFETLNQGFKDYYSKIKSLTESTQHLFKELLSIPDKDLKHHTVQTRHTKSELSDLYNFIIESDRLINLINKDIAYAFLHLNNQKQNLSTLKLLATNIQLEPKSRALYSELIEQVKSLQDIYTKIFNEFHQIEKRVQSCAEIVGQIRSDQLPLVIQIIDRYEKMLSDLADKKKFCNKNKKTLEELISRKYISSSEIITNLQFQDIIRQKIEHVYEAQTNLLKKLENYDLGRHNRQAGKSAEVIGIIIQIHDIGALQSAQLVHANNEYQKAVEIITEKFEELDHVLVDTIKLLNKLMPKIEAYNDHPVDELVKTNSHFEVEFKTLQDLCSRLRKMYPDLSRIDEVLVSSNTEMNASLKNFRETIKKLEPGNLNSGNQISTSFCTQLSGSFEDFFQNSKELTRILDQNHDKIINTVIPNLDNFFSQLNSYEEKVRDIVNVSQRVFFKDISFKNSSGIKDYEKVLHEKKFDSNSIQYYSVFDKEIEEIITNLNYLIGTINFKEIEKEFDTKNLKEIKKLYTMKSEWDIHSIITGEKRRNEETNHDLELF